MLKKNKGLTLVEVVVAMVVIGAMAFVLAYGLTLVGKKGQRDRLNVVENFSPNATYGLWQETMETAGAELFVVDSDTLAARFPEINVGLVRVKRVIHGPTHLLRHALVTLPYTPVMGDTVAVYVLNYQDTDNAHYGSLGTNIWISQKKN